jgi:hypothetical protein
MHGSHVLSVAVRNTASRVRPTNAFDCRGHVQASARNSVIQKLSQSIGTALSRGEGNRWSTIQQE